MSRYIDADAFKKYIKDGFEIAQPRFKTEQYRKLATESTMGFLEDIDDQPTADVVELVRCSDCKYGELDMQEQGYMEPPTCEGIICTKHKGLYMDFTDYCSYGERKDGAE